MAIFEKITFQWDGKDYAIPPEGVLRVIAQVEDVLTLAQLSRYINSGDWPIGKLSEAFGIMLRCAGANVTDEDVYASLFATGEMQKRAIDAIYTLQVLMIPPETLRKRLAAVKTSATSERADSSQKPTSS